MLSCSSRWQPPPRRQLPAVSSHINPRGGIRAKWLLLRGDRLDSHGPARHSSPAAFHKPRFLSLDGFLIPVSTSFGTRGLEGDSEGYRPIFPTTGQFFMPMTPGVDINTVISI